MSGFFFFFFWFLCSIYLSSISLSLFSFCLSRSKSLSLEIGAFDVMDIERKVLRSGEESLCLKLQCRRYQCLLLKAFFPCPVLLTCTSSHPNKPMSCISAKTWEQRSEFSWGILGVFGSSDSLGHHNEAYL